jgi:anti-sigma regulatory factor (Ser/Thr protein kinase)
VVTGEQGERFGCRSNGYSIGMADQEHEPDVRFRFGHDFRAAREARKQLDSLLDQPDDIIADNVRLAASEMVTNVVRHTDGGGEMRAWDPRPEVPLRVEVEDGDPSPPVIPSTPADTSIQSIGGRGLAIVSAVSHAWGFERLADGKIVWAEFDRDKQRLALLT